jgi:hypothetical protein
MQNSPYDILLGCPFYALAECITCQGTPVAVLMRVNICASALNKGSSGDPGAQSAVSRITQGQVDDYHV